MISPILPKTMYTINNPSDTVYHILNECTGFNLMYQARHNRQGSHGREKGRELFFSIPDLEEVGKNDCFQ